MRYGLERLRMAQGLSNVKMNTNLHKTFRAVILIVHLLLLLLLQLENLKCPWNIVQGGRSVSHLWLNERPSKDY